MTIKQQIMSRVLALMEALKAEGVRSVSREVNVMLMAPVLPAIQVYDGNETQVGEDHIGRTYDLAIGIKVACEGKDLVAEVEAWTGKIQDAIEADVQLAGLVNVITDRMVDPFLAEQNKPVGGAMIGYTVRYRTKRGANSETY